jgi:hypothetical protein
VVFDHPIHHITEDPKEAQPMSGMGADVNSQRGNAVKGDKAEKRYTRLKGFVQNWDEIDTSISHNKYPTIQDAVEYFKNDQGFSERTIRRAIEKHDDLMIQNGVILPKSSEP